MRTSTRRALIASTVGSTIEWYDFYLYSTAAALVLGPLFFPSTSTSASTLAVFATYAAGFVARPLGGLVVGHFGDRVGRKSMLVLTLLIMGVATFGIGLLPTYEQVGVWAPVMLVVLRVLQGIGIGGEWGGGVLLAVENAPRGRRGLYSSGPLIGFPLGLLASTVVFGAVSTLPRADLLDWGWRVPFLLSVVLVVLGVYVRVGIAETPEFSDVRAADRIRRVPVLTVLRTRWRHVVCGALAALGVGSVVSVYTVYLLSFASGHSAGGSTLPLTGLVVGAGLQCVSVPLYAALSDRVGRKPVMVFGYLVTAATAVPAMTWLTSDDPFLVVLTFVLAMTVGHGAAYGCLAAFLVDRFPADTRYSAIAVTYQVGATASSFVPLVATALVGGVEGSWPVAALFIGIACTACLAVLLAPAATAAGEPVRDREVAGSTVG
ncbi:MFS transporter [Umezawaea sp.]|uniref:MFS transporter n=1 Tax=Umezawaea sp. TaxID=1955258 RepID=UPI002ED59B6B